MAKLLDRSFDEGEARVKTKMFSTPGGLLLPHEHCRSIAGGSDQMALEQILLPHQLCGSRYGDSRFSDSPVKRDISPTKDETILLPHELGGSSRSRIASEEILLPHQQFGSACNGSSRFEDHTVKSKISLKKDKDLLLPQELGRSGCSNKGRTTTEEFVLPHERCEPRCRSGNTIHEKILLPHESLGNKSYVPNPDVIKPKTSTKKDQNLLLPHEVYQSDPCTLSIEIQMPHEHPSRCSGCSTMSKDILLLMNVAGTSFELSVRRNL